MNEWVFYEEPLYWAKYNLLVIAERYTEQGVREHLVSGWVEPDLVLDNANIYGTE